MIVHKTIAMNSMFAALFDFLRMRKTPDNPRIKIPACLRL